MDRNVLISCLLAVPLTACDTGDRSFAENGAGASGTAGVPGGGGSAVVTSGAGMPSSGGTTTGGGMPSTPGTPMAGSTSAAGGTSPGGLAGAAPVAGASTSGGSGPSNTAGASAGGISAGGGASVGGAASGGGTDTGGAPNLPSGPAGEMPGSACTREFTIPSFAELASNPKMPDPFTFLDGSKVTTKDDWVCRQKEISLLAQAFIYGPKPGKPEMMEAEFSGGTLTIDMQSGDRSWTLSVDIETPSGDGPFPAVFNVDGGGAPAGLASIATSLGWLTSNVAAAGSGRGTSGEFYDFHPDSTDTGSLMAWAWAASRIVDGLEMTEGHNIDTTKLHGLGCSRNGKTAATMALFDQRMAMIAMYSPGSGSTSGWRVADVQTGSVQTAEQIFGETTWMGEPFGQFGSAVEKLPIDQHEVLALAWPRPLLVREGTMDSWNCPVCVYTTVKYTQLIYEALGNKDDVGFTHYNGGHCANGGQEWSDTYQAFVDKYLFGDDSADTTGHFTESFTFDADEWQDGALTPIP